MFNNRQSRRRFRLGNLARLVQLRQSVNHQPPPPPSILYETLSQSQPQSPPTLQPQLPQSSSSQLSPTQFPSPRPSTSTPPPEPKSSPLSPLSPNIKEEPQSNPMQQLMPKHVNTHRSLLIQSPPQSPPESAESQPLPLALVAPPTPEAKTSLSPSTLKETIEEYQSQPSPPLPAFKSNDETWFQPSPPSLSESGESQPLLSPPKDKSQSSTLNATEEFQSQTSHISPLPPDTKKSPSTINATEELQSETLLPSKSINETWLRSSPPSLSETGETQPPLSPPEAKPSPSLQLSNTKEPQSPPPPPSKFIEETRLGTPPLSQAFSSLSDSGPFQPLLPPPESKILPSTKRATEFSQPQSPPPVLPSKSIDVSLFRSPPMSPPPTLSLSKSGETQPLLQPPEAKIIPSPPSMLNTTEETLLLSKSINKTGIRSPLPSPPSSGKSQPSLPRPVAKLSPSKSIEENQSRSLLPPSESDKSQSSPPEAKISPSELKATEESQHQPFLPSKSINEISYQSPPSPSKSTNEPTKSTPPLPEFDKQSISKTDTPSPMLSQLSPVLMKSPIPSPSTSTAIITAPPPLSSPLKFQIVPSPKTSLTLVKPNQIESLHPNPINTESHISPHHNNDQNYNPEKPDAKLVNKILAENEAFKTEITGKVNKNRENTNWTEEKTEPTMRMFINSNVQGFNTSLSLDSSSIDHKPGVHVTIHHDQLCDFSSKVF